MTTNTRETPSEVAREFARAVVLTNARSWFRSDWPRTYSRNADTDKHMRVKMKREIDEIFAQQNKEFDDALMAWYERTYVSYGGDVNDLPWVDAFGTHD
jgi:hypothetical protein